MNDINMYQHIATEYAVYEHSMYPKVSLLIESAELCDLFVKPELRGDDQVATRNEIISEAGDVLWNLAVLLESENILLSEVAEYNLQKLDDRKERGVLKGSGGDR